MTRETRNSQVERPYGQKEGGSGMESAQDNYLTMLYFLFTESFSALPALKEGAVEALILISLPV